MPLTWASALTWRLQRQYLLTSRAPSAERVVERLVAVPAWSGDARTAIGLRLARPRNDAVDDAVADGRLIRVYAFRGATQLMTPRTAAVHLSIRSAGRQWERKSWCTHYELQPQDWPRLRATVRDVLSDGPLTQHELATAVARDPAYRHLLEAFDHGSHTFLKPFCWQGDLCFAPSHDGEPTFRALASVPGWEGLTPLDEAGPVAVRAYLSAYGPATRDRIDYWLGEGLSAGRRRLAGWVEAATEGVADLEIDGERALCLADQVEQVMGSATTDEVVLLPGADQWVLGPGTSDAHVVPPGHRIDATRGAALVIVAGRVSGRWELVGDTVRVRWFPREAVGDGASLSRAVGRLSSVLGRDLELATAGRVLPC